MEIIWRSIIWMASKSNNVDWPSNNLCRVLGGCVVAWGVMLIATCVEACPFCTALTPTLSQRREAAQVVALAELESDVQGASRAAVALHQVFAGDDFLDSRSDLQVALGLSARSGTLVLLFGSGDTLEEMTWQAEIVNEASAAYFAGAPRRDLPVEQRLAYFVRYLEHPDALVATDAYLEFGHAPFDAVSAVESLFSMPRVRDWLVDAGVPPERKGFYGLVLGLALDPAQQLLNTRHLQEQILAPEDDFRAGFDGILGGYLLLTGQEGLNLLEARYLANPASAVGDVRHVQSALRFYHEYGRSIAPERLGKALVPLLHRPEFAESTIIDLARWGQWDALEQIVSLYDTTGHQDNATRRAIVGYLRACPRPFARVALDSLRQQDPQGVSDAEKILSTTGGIPLTQ